MSEQVSRCEFPAATGVGLAAAAGATAASAQFVSGGTDIHGGANIASEEET